MAGGLSVVPGAWLGSGTGALGGGQVGGQRHPFRVRTATLQPVPRAAVTETRGTIVTGSGLIWHDRASSPSQLS